ncbi:Nuclear transcription factor Y subunit [Arachis hypogaea]|nr:Nuclear transcription factor Y subunit [Arachis hypogaea]
MVDNIGGSGSSNNEGIIKEQDRLLPIANVGRIMKQILPQNAKISKEAKETMQECVSEYISFVTSEASEKCRKERRKTVNGDDICWALATLGFDDYAEGMRRYLHRYRELEVVVLMIPFPSEGSMQVKVFENEIM